MVNLRAIRQSDLWFILIVCTGILMVISLPVYSAPYRNYTYDYWGNSLSAPQAYLPSRVLGGREMGIDDLNEPEDLFIAEDRIYIADSGNNRIIVLDESWQALNIIDSFDNDGKEDRFNNPHGVFATGDSLYVADRDNSRIIVLDKEGSLLEEIGPPRADVEGVITEGFRYRPEKVGVDPAGRMYVVSYGVYDGMLEFAVDGNFRGFIGAPRITPDMFDYIWRRIATQEQVARMALTLPVELSNLDIDDRGFIYTTATGGALSREEMIRRLNPSGQDILRRMGFHPPIGDYGSAFIGEHGQFVLDRSILVDVKSQDYGIYSLLDRRRGRVFTYDANGNLLFVFGGRGQVKGTFRRPTALDIVPQKNSIAPKMAVLDSDKGQVTLFSPTRYTELILSAIQLYHRGQYDRSATMWEQVLARNINYDLAHSGIGRAMFRRGEYTKAMDHFRLGHDRQNYSTAFALYRRDLIAENFSMVILMLGLFAIVILANRRLDGRLFSLFSARGARDSLARTQSSVEESLALRSGSNVRQIIDGIRYALHLILHPFSGFWELKHEGKGNLLAASSLVVLCIGAYLVMSQYTGFLFNPRDLTKLNIFVEVASIIIPFFLWCAVNWGLTTLMDGKGTFKDIFIYSSFSLMPIILIFIPMTILSNFIILEEGAFYYFALTIAVLWMSVLIFCGTMVAHEYDIPKTVLTILLIFVGMGVVLFVGMLFFGVGGRLVSFLSTIYTEISLR